MAGKQAGQHVATDRFADVSLEAESETGPDPRQRSDSAFRILVLANLAGAGERALLQQRSPMLIDRDNLDDVLARFAPRLAHNGSVISFAGLGDFHPDRLWERVPIFNALRDLRQRLDNPRTFQQAADQLLGRTQTPAAPAKPQSSGGSLLDQIVSEVAGSAPPAAAAPARSADDLQEQIRQIVRPHILPGEDPRKAILVERVDVAATEVLRSLLHDRGFQSLESAWRALDLPDSPR